jgi:ABC-type histidine transport system ATPase subunit
MFTYLYKGNEEEWGTVNEVLSKSENPQLQKFLHYQAL